MRTAAAEVATRGGRRVAALVIALAIGVALSACGSTDQADVTIPNENAQAMIADLDQAQQALGSDCRTAEQAAGDFVDQVNLLPSQVGTEAKDRLRDAGENLKKLIGAQCQPSGATGEAGVVPETTTSTPPETTSEEATNTTTTETEEEPPPTEGGGNPPPGPAGNGPEGEGPPGHEGGGTGGSGGTEGSGGTGAG
jgi:hypothetical protein